MASPVQLPLAFDGMAQDFPRNNLPRGKAWNLVDYIPQILGAPAEERGGWAYASASLTAIDAAATRVVGLLEASFIGGAQNVVITDTGKLISLVGGINTLIGTAVVPVQNPFMHQQVVVIPSPDGTTAPKKYDAVIAALGATAPAGKYGTVWVNYTWLGGTAALPYRSYPSAVGDPTTYNVANYVDTSFPVKGYAALPNVLLVFGEKVTARFSGSTPPPNSDIRVDDPVFNYGCIDARSIAVNGSLAVFANERGVILTNGTAFPEDLTKSCGISTYWRNLLTGYSSSTWTVASGWFGSIVLVCVMNGTTLIDTIALDTAKRQAYRISNLKATTFAAAGSTGQELFAGSRVSPRVLQLASMWTPGSAYKNDGDGAAVTAVYESPYYETQRIGGQRWRDAYLSYDLRDAATDDPTMTVLVTESPESGAAYKTLSPGAAETTAKTTKRIPIRMKNRGMGFKVTRTNASAHARLYGLGATVYQREGSRVDA